MDVKEITLSTGGTILIRPAFARDLLSAGKIVGPGPQQFEIGVALLSLCATPKAESTISFDNWLDRPLDEIARALSEFISPAELTIAAAMLDSATRHPIVSVHIPEFPAPMLVKKKLSSGKLAVIRKYTVAEMRAASGFGESLCEKYLAMTAAICQLDGASLTYDEVLRLDLREVLELELLKFSSFAVMPAGVTDVLQALRGIGFSNDECDSMYIDEAAHWLSARNV
jgi:hypothetical protein